MNKPRIIGKTLPAFGRQQSRTNTRRIKIRAVVSVSNIFFSISYITRRKYYYSVYTGLYGGIESERGVRRIIQFWGVWRTWKLITNRLSQVWKITFEVLADNKHKTYARNNNKKKKKLCNKKYNFFFSGLIIADNSIIPRYLLKTLIFFKPTCAFSRNVSNAHQTNHRTISPTNLALQ